MSFFQSSENSHNFGVLNNRLPNRIAKILNKETESIIQPRLLITKVTNQSEWINLQKQVF